MIHHQPTCHEPRNLRVYNDLEYFTVTCFAMPGISAIGPPSATAYMLGTKVHTLPLLLC